MVYVEKEDEFESSLSNESCDDMEVEYTDVKGIEELSSKQRKLLNTYIDMPDLNQVQTGEHIQVQLQSDDSFAVLARKHIH